MGALSGKGPNPLYHYLRMNRRLYVAWLKTVATGRMAAAAVGCRTAAAVVLVDKICSVEAAQFRALDVGVGERGVDAAGGTGPRRRNICRRIGGRGRCRIF